MSEKKEKLYCPMCTGELDDTDSCWVRCEYEADGALPEYAPLNRMQVLQRRLDEAESKLKKTAECVVDLELEMLVYKKQLGALS